MRIAAFNVENLFDRTKAFGMTIRNYTAGDKNKMLDLMDQLGVLNRDEGRFVRIRKIRGQLIKRPHDKNKPREIVAKGRQDWVGWCELKTASVNEVAVVNTGRVMRDLEADILAVVEVESRPVLYEMNQTILKEVNGTPYPNIMVIDGNDLRGIDVGLMTREGYDIGLMRSHVHETTNGGTRIFSRDCPEYEVKTPSGETIWVLPNHFKSKYGGNDAKSRAKRLAQSNAVAAYYQRLKDEGQEFIVVLGDLNDTPDSEELVPLSQTDLKDASEHPSFTDFEFEVNNNHRGIGTYGLGNDTDKIDYLLLSPALFERMENGGLFRKGAWPGVRPQRWEIYPQLEKKVHAASDHHAIFADIDI